VESVFVVVSVCGVGFLRGPLRIRFCVVCCVISFAGRDRLFFEPIAQGLCFSLL
jgi:hypothetical protein